MPELLFLTLNINYLNVHLYRLFFKMTVLTPGPKTLQAGKPPEWCLA